MEPVERFGQLDILANNIGSFVPRTPATMEEATWRRKLDLNLTSASLTSGAAPPVMQGQCGAIVNISSVAGMRCLSKEQVAYVATRAGLAQITRVAALAATNMVSMHVRTGV